MEIVYRLKMCSHFKGIAKLLVADCETLAKVGLCCHFDSVIRPEAERIGAGVAV